MESERINVHNLYLLVILCVERCKVKESADGATELSTLAHTPKVRKKAMENMYTRTVRPTKAYGERENHSS